MVAVTSLLHISDLHFSSPGSNYADDAKSFVDPALRATRFRRLKKMLESGFRSTHLDAAILTGDITTAGRTAGFSEFQSSIGPMLVKLLPTSASMCVVPGNHDVVWGLDPRTPDYFDKKFADYFRCVNDLGATSSYVPIGTLPADPNSDITFASTLGKPLYIDREKKLIILCINSALRCGEINSDMRKKLRDPLDSATAQIEGLIGRFGKYHEEAVPLESSRVYLRQLDPLIDRYSLFDIPSITQTQLDQLESCLSDHRQDFEGEWNHFIKIAAVHHHLAPFDYQMPEHKAFEAIADASSLLSLLAAFGFHIVLTGHKHQPYRQRVQAAGKELLLLGGMTVGGYPVPGFPPGARFLEVQQSNDLISVAIAELNCIWEGDMSQHVRNAIMLAKAKPEVIALERPAAYKQRISYPRPIEAAIERQLYGRAFYKLNAKFEITASRNDAGSLVLRTCMSYIVVNRASSAADWYTEFDFDSSSGRVTKAVIGDEECDPKAVEYRTGRGFRVRRQVLPSQELPVYVESEEAWPDHGSAMFTSYHAASDFTLVLVNDAPDIEFDPEVLYSWDRFPVKTGSKTVISLEQGLLPYQGVKLNWARKEEERHA